MNTFTSILSDKLALATEPKRYELSAFPSTTITTANTISTLATYSSAHLKAADRIEAAYRLVVDNQSSATEGFTITLDLGADTFTRTFSIANTDTDVIGVTAKLTRISASTFLAELNFIFTVEAGTITTFPVVTTITDTRVTEVTIKAENTSTVGATCDLIGNGGYVVVDSYNA